MIIFSNYVGYLNRDKIVHSEKNWLLFVYLKYILKIVKNIKFSSNMLFVGL